MTYSEKLKSPKWQKKRLEILQRDNFKCCLCGDEETELHVHHLKYVGSNPYDTPNKYLETLCKHCHNLKSTFQVPMVGTFVKAKINGDSIIAMTDDDYVYLFSYSNNVLHLETSFSNDSITLHEFIKFCNKNWLSKKNMS